MTAQERVRAARLAVDLAQNAAERRPSAWASERLEWALLELEHAEADAIADERQVAA